jgi:hypothetical protein
MLLLADTYQRFYRIGQEVPSMPNILLEDEGTSRSYVFLSSELVPSLSGGLITLRATHCQQGGTAISS